jgi:hypothetical protein
MVGEGLMQKVIPVSTLCTVCALWLVIDIVDIVWLHWFQTVTPKTASFKFFFGMMLVLTSYMISGRKA